MEVAAVLYTGFMLALLIGTERRFKLIAGGVILASALIFLIGEIMIKFRTDFYSLGTVEWRNQGYAEALGEWVVPFVLIGLILFLILVNIRCIMQYKKRIGSARWIWIALMILIDLLALVTVPFIIFIVAFMFFPFAP